MQVDTGMEEMYLISSVAGRLVATFTERRKADEWLEQRADNGVVYRLYKRSSDTQEIALSTLALQDQT